MRVARRGLLGTMMTLSACATCCGHGTIVSEPCPACRGAGAVTGDRKVRVEIPAGVSDGTRLRLSGRGEHPGRRGVAGDLHVEIRTRPSEEFRPRRRQPDPPTQVGHGRGRSRGQGRDPAARGRHRASRDPARAPSPRQFSGCRAWGRPTSVGEGAATCWSSPTSRFRPSSAREEEEALRTFAQLRGERTGGTSGQAPTKPVSGPYPPPVPAPAVAAERGPDPAGLFPSS